MSLPHRLSTISRLLLISLLSCPCFTADKFPEAVNPFQVSIDNIESMATQGDLQGAVDQALAISRKWANEGFDMPDYRFRWRRVIETFNLTGPLIQTSEHKTLDDQKQILAHAFLLLHLSHDEEALPYLKQAVESENETPEALIVAYVVQSYRINPDNTHRILMNLDESIRNKVITEIGERINWADWPQALTVYPAVKLVCRLLESAPGKSGIQASSLRYIIPSIHDYIVLPVRQTTPRRLYSHEGFEQLRIDPEPQISERFALHQRLFTALLKHPELAPDALARLIYVNEQLQLPITDLVSQVKPVFINYLKAPYQPYTLESTWYTLGHIRSPLVTLVHYAHKNQNPEMALDLLNTLQELEEPQDDHKKDEHQLLIDQLSSTIDLYTSDLSDFSTFLKRNVNRHPFAFRTIYGDNHILTALESLEIRNKSIPLGDLAIQQAKLKGATELAIYHATALSKSLDLTDLNLFCDQLEAEMIGTGEDREQALEQLRGFTQQNHRLPDNQFKTILNIYKYIGRNNPRLSAWAINRLHKIGIEAYALQIFEAMKSLFIKHDAAITIATLESSPLLNEASNYKHLHRRTVRDSSILRALIDASRDELGFGIKLATDLAQHPTRETFGNRLIRYAIQQDTRQLLQLLSSHASVLASWEQAEIGDFLIDLRDIFNIPFFADYTDPVAAAGWEWWQAHCQILDDNALQEKNKSDRLWLSHGNLLEDLQPLHPYLLSIYDSHRLIETLRHADHLNVKARTADEPDGHLRLYDGDSAAGTILTQLLEHPASEQVAAGMCSKTLALARGDEDLVIPFSHHLRQAIAAHWRDWISHDPDQSLPRLIQITAQHGFDDDWSGSVACLIAALNTTDGASINRLSKEGLTKQPGTALWTAGLASTLINQDSRHLTSYVKQTETLIPPVSDELSESARRWSAELLGTIGAHSPAIALKGQHTLLKASEQLASHGEVSHLALGGILRLSRLADPSTPPSPLLQAAVNTHLTLHNDKTNTIRGDTPENRVQLPPDTVSLGLEILKLSYRANQTTLRQRLFTLQPQLTREVATWQILIEHEDTAALAQLISHELLTTVKPTWLTEEFTNKLKRILPAISNKEHRLIVEIIMSSLPGPNPDDHIHRMTRLMETIDLGTLTTPEFFNLIHQTLAPYDRDLVRAYTAAAASKIDLKRAFHRDAEHNIALQTHIWACLQGGDALETIAFTDSMVAAFQAHGGYQYQLEVVLDTYHRWLIAKDWSGRALSDLQAAIEVGDHLLAIGLAMNKPDLGRHVSEVVALRLLCQGPEGISNWAQKLADNTNFEHNPLHQYKSSLDHIITILARSSTSVRTLTNDRRLELLHALMTIDQEIELAQPGQNMLSSIVRHQLATWEEIYAICAQGFGQYVATALRYRATCLGKNGRENECEIIHELLSSFVNNHNTQDP